MTGAKSGGKDASTDSMPSNTPIYVGSPLPGDCPPQDGAPFLAEQIVLRLVPQDPARDSDFLPSSQLPKRRRPHWCDECRWCSCSVYPSSEANLLRLRTLTKLKNLEKMKFIAHVKVDPDAGVAKPWPNDPEHVSFWAVTSFSPAAATEKCEAV